MVKPIDKNILMGSVRAGHFIGPLDAAASSFYTLYDCLAKTWDGYIYKGKDNKQYKLNFGYFNAVPSDESPRANLEELCKADVFLLVAENEFQYANNKVNPMYRQYLDDRLENIRKCLRNKTVIVLNSDVNHTPKLIKNYTLNKIPLKQFDWISENDFPGNVHTLKYYFLNDLSKKKQVKKSIDFGYWGSYRDSDDIRADVLKNLRKNNPDIKSLYIGHLPPYTDIKWTRKFQSVVPDLQKVKTTLAFGVDQDPNWLTARYHEAMGLGIIPFVWKNYDKKNKLGIIPWQRVSSVEELVKKIKEVKDPKIWNKKYSEILKNYKKNILQPEELYALWEEKILPTLTFLKK